MNNSFKVYKYFLVRQLDKRIIRDNDLSDSEEEDDRRNESIGQEDEDISMKTTNHSTDYEDDLDVEDAERDSPSNGKRYH